MRKKGGGERKKGNKEEGGGRQRGPNMAEKENYHCKTSLKILGSHLSKMGRGRRPQKVQKISKGEY